MSQDTLYVGVPATLACSVTNAAGAAFSPASVSAQYGYIGSGPPKIAALTSSETGTFSCQITPAAQGTLTTKITGYDSDGNVLVIGQCQYIISPAAWS